VFAHHSLPPAPGGYLDMGLSALAADGLAAVVAAGGFGVDLFFVLSAYLITELLLREQAQHGRLDVFAFYARRVLRIWPLYYGFLALVLLFEPACIPGHRMPLAHKLSFAFFAANWSCAWLGYPSSVAALLWSISIEEQFYLVRPLVVSLCRGRRLAQCAGALLVVATLTRLFLVLRGVEHPGIWCNTLARLDPIACSAGLSLLLRLLRARPGSERAATRRCGGARRAGSDLIRPVRLPRARARNDIACHAWFLVRRRPRVPVGAQGRARLWPQRDAGRRFVSLAGTPLSSA
jgi:peptidoglycan/LPS O-acetylase OafA/YrhL